ncbi:unnamed protein product [Trichobilharzia szidati]|nr:unnamed protein product [Trichobilharzia szidati]
MSHISEIQDQHFVDRINQIYSKEIDINQFIKHTYNLLNDLIYHYKIEDFSLHSVNVLGKFISYILTTYRGLDDLNKKCIETLKQLFSNRLFSIKLKNRLMYRLELNIASNLLYKQSRIDQYTWECICIYVIHCKNIFPPIRILIFFGICTISNPAEHTRCLNKLNHLIKTMPMYGVDFFEIVMTIKLLIDKSNSLHSKIKLFCLKIMKLIKLNMNKLDYENALRCIKPGMFYSLDIENTTNDLNTTPTTDNTLHESIILPESLNESSVYSVDSLHDYLPTTHLASESIQIIPNYICSMLHERYNIPVQLDGIKALKEYVKKRFCCGNAYEVFENEKHYIQGVQCLLISIFHLMNNQIAFMIVHFADIILVSILGNN